MTDKHRWQGECNIKGCFLEYGHPQIELFNDCFPGKIGFTDIDAAVEYNNAFLFLEWKSSKNVELPVGQRVFIERLVRWGATYIVVSGNPKTMLVEKVVLFSANNLTGKDFHITNLEGLKRLIYRWVIWVNGIRDWQNEFGESINKAYSSPRP